MGEANRRGTFETRKNIALNNKAKKKQKLKDTKARHKRILMAGSLKKF